MTSSNNNTPVEMHRRRITMPDGRYMIFYTFGDEGEKPGPEPVDKPVSGEEPSDV
jgi:hypothetical protein